MYPRRLEGIYPITAVLAAMAMLVMLSACDQAPSPAAALKDSFELVLETRPEPAAAYHFPTQTAYDLCASGAAMLKLSVHPFVSITDDYVTERRTVISDGINRYDTTENFFIDLSGMDMKSGCTTSLKSVSTTEVYSNGQVQKSSVTADGAVHAAAPVAAISRSTSGNADTGQYSVKKIHKGYALRCLAPNSPAMDKKVLLESCIYDASEGRTLTDANGAAIAVLVRVQAPHVSKGPAHTLLTEPRVLKAGKPVDMTAFTFIAVSP